MSEARAITNLIGNAVATMAIARWNGALDLAQARAVLDGNREVTRSRLQAPGTRRIQGLVEGHRLARKQSAGTNLRATVPIPRAPSGPEPRVPRSRASYDRALRPDAQRQRERGLAFALDVGVGRVDSRIDAELAEVQPDTSSRLPAIARVVGATARLENQEPILGARPERQVVQTILVRLIVGGPLRDLSDERPCAGAISDITECIRPAA